MKRKMISCEKIFSKSFFIVDSDSGDNVDFSIWQSKALQFKKTFQTFDFRNLALTIKEYYVDTSEKQIMTRKF